MRKRERQRTRGRSGVSCQWSAGRRYGRLGEDGQKDRKLERNKEGKKDRRKNERKKEWKDKESNIKSVYCSMIRVGSKYCEIHSEMFFFI